MADGAGNGHTDQHDGHGNHLVHIRKVHLAQTLQHQNAHIDQRGGGSCGRNDGGDGGDEHTGQEQHAGGQCSQTGAAAGFHAGGGFDEGGNGGGTGAGAHHGAHGIGKQGFLHVGHIALLVHHAGPGGGADQGADGIEHIDDAEGDGQRNDGEPADLHQACEVKLEEGGVDHILHRGQEGSTGQGCEGIGVQEDKGAAPMDHGGDQHTDQHSALDALLGQRNDGKQADEHGDHGQNHGAVAAAHGALGHAGSQCAEEITHHEEGAAVFAVNSGVGAQADVHQHQTDGGADAQADAQGDGLDDLVADIENGQNDEHDAFDQNDDQRGLEGGQIAHTGQAYDVAHHHSKEAVQAHAGGHGEGLVGQKCHAEHTDGGGDAGCHEHAIPQGAAGVKIGQQVGVQGDDVGHGHEGGQTGHDLGADIGAICFELENFLKHDGYPFFLFSIFGIMEIAVSIVAPIVRLCKMKFCFFFCLSFPGRPVLSQMKVTQNIFYRMMRIPIKPLACLPLPMGI